MLNVLKFPPKKYEKNYNNVYFFMLMMNILLSEYIHFHLELVSLSCLFLEVAEFQSE
jgi:hypothetical protein